MTVLRYCSTTGCQRLVRSGRCPTHQREDSQRRQAKVKAYGYHSPNWQRVRRARLVIADYRCELGLPGCKGKATHVHLDEAMQGAHYLATVEDARACCSSCSGAVDAPRSQRGGIKRGVGA